MEKNKNTASNPKVCSLCKNHSSKVNIKTVKHWLQTPFISNVPEEKFYFCTSADCSVVYFSEQGTIYKKEDMRGRIGIKEKEEPIPVCYCFGVTKEMIKREIAESGKSDFSKWIKIEVKNENCGCDIRSPSGRCCLAAIKQIEQE